MMFWLLAAFLLFLTLIGALWPLVARSRAVADASDVQIYKDQLREIDRDIERGVVAAVDGEASKAEIGRRLIAAARAGGNEPELAFRPARLLAILLVVILPAASMAAYIYLGSPGLPDAPLQARLEAAAEQAAAGESDLEALVSQVEAHLARNPDDGEGWRVIAPVYARRGQFDKAAEAFEKALSLTTPTTALWTAYGEALVASTGGSVSTKAQEAFQEALKLSPDDVKARFYLAMALQQTGRFDDAAAAWAALLEGAPENASWVQMARRLRSEAVASGGNSASAGNGAAEEPGPSRDDVRAAADMAPEDQRAFIESMVSGLRTRLDTEGGDVDEWVRLIRAYIVLGQSEEASAAYERGRGAFAADESALIRLADAAKSLGVPIGE